MESTVPDAQAKLPSLPLFYSDPVLLRDTEHERYSLKANIGYGFSANANAVPLNLAEFEEAARHYPIAFTGTEQPVAVAILGLRDGENLFVDASGRWEAGFYIPAYIRRYPFIIMEHPGKPDLSLCVDQTNNMLIEGKDNPLFVERQPSLLARRALEFCLNYHAAAMATRTFCEGIASLLANSQVQVALPGGRTANLSGFRDIEPARLDGVSNELFLTWRRNGWLSGLYAQMHSRQNWTRLGERLSGRVPMAADQPLAANQPVAGQA
jgi:SapC